MYEEALTYAMDKHRGQVRKYTGEPYILHPMKVASAHSCDLMKTIAVLHDVVEDTNATFTEIAKLFGDDIATSVWWLTDETTVEKGNRRIRKAITCRKLHYAPLHIKAIKIFDMIDNAESIKQHDPEFFKLFKKECLAMCDEIPSHLKGHAHLLKILKGE